MQNKVRYNCKRLGHNANAMKVLVKTIKENTCRLEELHAYNVLTSTMAFQYIALFRNLNARVIELTETNCHILRNFQDDLDEEFTNKQEEASVNG